MNIIVYPCWLACCCLWTETAAISPPSMVDPRSREGCMGSHAQLRSRCVRSDARDDSVQCQSAQPLSALPMTWCCSRRSDCLAVGAWTIFFSTKALRKRDSSGVRGWKNEGKKGD